MRKKRNTSRTDNAPNFYEAAWRVVREIPKGRVMTYGQVATILGAPRAARAVGYAMLHSGDSNVPWQRVINRHGQISMGGDAERPALQRKLLEDEGVVFDESDSCDLAVFRWEPDDPERFFFDASSVVPF